jgi:purine-binding chemotaxis protein CheW
MSTKTPVQENPSTLNFSSGKFLTFKLADKLCGIEVLSIREIVRAQSITPVPKMPPYVKGVTNLRGKLTPVIDLCTKFGLEAGNGTDRPCMVVVETRNSEAATDLLGLIVDAVEEVVNIDEIQLESSSDLGNFENTEAHIGVVKSKGGTVHLLDARKVLSQDISDAFEIQ